MTLVCGVSYAIVKTPGTSISIDTNTTSGEYKNATDVQKLAEISSTVSASKENTLVAGTASQYYRGDKTWQELNQTVVGLSNVDNTADLDKPISTAVSTQFGLYYNKTDSNLRYLQSEVDGSVTNELPLAGDDIDVGIDNRTVSIEPTLDTVVKVNGVSEIAFDITPTLTADAEGKMYYSTSEQTVVFGVSDGSISVNKEIFEIYTNLSGTTLVDFDVVSIVGVSGGRTAVALTDVTNPESVRNCIGVVTTASVAPNGLVRVTKEGTVHGHLGGYAEAATYVNPLVPGKLTQVKPSAPYPAIQVGIVSKAHPTNGELDVHITCTHSFTELSDVNGTPLTVDGQFAVWDNTAGYFDFTAKTSDFALDTKTHNQFAGLQGGTTDEFYHMTSAQHTIAIRAGNASQSGYITASDFTNFSTAYGALAIASEPSGFGVPENVGVTYNATARTVALSGTFTAYWCGVPITALTNGYVSPAHADVANTYYLYYDGSTVQWSTTPWTFDKVQIAIAYYAGSGIGWAIKETHGLMQWQSHKEAHRFIGTSWVSGADLSAFIINSTTPADRRPQISATVIADEDIDHTLPSLATNAYSQLTLASASTATITSDNADIVPLSGNQPYYNLFTGGVWTQVLMPVNSYQKVLILAIPVSGDAASQKYRYVFVQGQTQSTSLPTIQALTPANYSLGQYGTSIAEYVYVGEVILRYTANNWVIAVQPVKYTGSRFTQTAASANSADSAVSTDATLTGNGTPAAPLSVAVPSPFMASGNNAYLSVNGNTAGFVGIGTTNPTVLLDVAGTIRSSTTVYPNVALNSANRLTFGENNPPANETGSVVGFGSGSTGRNMVFSIAKTGVNTSFFGCNGSALVIGEEGANPIIFKNGLSYTAADILASGTEQMRIAGGGNVGIGITNPTSKLHTSGFQLGTSTTAGYVLTADASGVGTYQGAERQFPATMLGQANSTTGYFKIGSGDTTNSASGAIMNSDNYNNGSILGFAAPRAMTVKSVTIYAGPCAVSQATKGATITLRLALYKVNGTGRTLVGNMDIPVPTTNVGVNNNLGGSAIGAATLTGLSLAIAQGDVFGWVFENRGTDNTMINAASRVTSVVVAQ